jgi:predicted enzyme related to lactoylglutathione lyase
MAAQQDRYIPGVPCWIDTTPPDLDVSLAFYGELFGWDFEDVAPEGAPGPYHVAQLGGKSVAAVRPQQPGQSRPATWNTYVWVEDADATAARVRDAGGTVIVETRETGDAGRMAVFADPEGATFCIWEPKAHRGAEVVNEPGSLNFNVLHTRDLEAAQAFYGAVFGWEVIHGAFWALPAYGDFLEQRTPGLRENIAAMGAPPRFEEVVASVGPIPADQPGVRPHWGVTFAVDDADTIAARATELGGRVDVPPVDAPWTRMTVITDPQGASFVASKYVPENKDLEPDGSSATAA